MLHETLEGEICSPRNKRICLIAAGGLGLESRKNFLTTEGACDAQKWMGWGRGELARVG
jgi:hypothetical protein